jgi:hypothetical protein
MDSSTDFVRARRQSHDSRDLHQWGLLPLENAIGKSVLIWLAAIRLEIINHTDEVLTAQ